MFENKKTLTDICHTYLNNTFITFAINYLYKYLIIYFIIILLNGALNLFNYEISQFTL